MKLLSFTILFSTIYYASAGKTARLLAAINAMNAMGMGVNPAAAGLVGGGLVGGGLVGGGLAGGGLVRPILVPGAAGFIGQPQFPQFVPGLPAFGVPAAAIPNMYPAPVPAANQYPYMRVAQMMPVNPAQPLPQQQVMGGFPMQQQQQQPFPAQPDPLQRFRRQVMAPDSTAVTTVDTQIPSPTDVPRPCSSEVPHQNN